MEPGSWKTDIRTKKMEPRSWIMRLDNRKKSTKGPGPGEGGVSCTALLATCPACPGGPWDQYIRSGPEGARGVLKVSGWSFCILLAELSSLKSSEGHLFLKFTSWRSPFSEISSTFPSGSNLSRNFRPRLTCFSNLPGQLCGTHEDSLPSGSLPSGCLPFVVFL